MGVIQVDYNPAQLAAAQSELADAGVKIPQVLAEAANDAAKSLKVKVSEAIRAKVNIKKKDVDKYITIARGNRAHQAAGVRLSESERIPLKYFDAKQTDQGVSYQINKNGQRMLAKHAFGPNIQNKLHGHVYRRIGKKRLPIRKLLGPSPWGVYVENNLDLPILGAAQDLLNKALEHRVHYELLKSRGEI